MSLSDPTATLMFAEAAEAADVVARCEALGVRALALRADVTVESEAQGLVDAAAEALGGLRVLVNNVGAYHRGPLDELDGATWRRMFDSRRGLRARKGGVWLPIAGHGARVLEKMA